MLRILIKDFFVTILSKLIDLVRDRRRKADQQKVNLSVFNNGNIIVFIINSGKK